MLASELDLSAACGSFFDLLVEEIEFHKNSTKYLDRKQYSTLLRRYSAWTRRKKFFKYLYVRQLRNFVGQIIGSLQPPNILDMGCGFGSESILCGLLGATVKGIDMDAFRLDIANKRKRYYEEKVKKSIKATFINKNVLTYRPRCKFDLILAREFIEHVHPLSAFFQTLRSLLKPTGLAIIIAANPLHPHAAVGAWLAHRHKLIEYVKYSETQNRVPYAVERLVSTNSIKYNYKFRIHEMNFYCFFPFYFPFISHVESLANRVPFLKFLGHAYELVGTPANFHEKNFDSKP